MLDRLLGEQILKLTKAVARVRAYERRHRARAAVLDATERAGATTA